MLEALLFDLAMKEGEKAAAIVVSKIATTIASALVASEVVKNVRKDDKPLVLYSGDERNEVVTNRVIRDSSVTASITLIGTALHMCIGNVVEQSDII